MIAKLEGEEAHSHGVARRVGKHTSTISGELRRNAATVTPHDRLFDLGVKRLWREEQLDEYDSVLWDNGKELCGSRVSVAFDR